VPYAQDYYAGISGSRERLSVAYQMAARPAFWEIADTEALQAALAEALAQNRAHDQRRQTTTLGPHRDDLLLCLDGEALRQFGSQGQQRSAALALKLAEAAVARDMCEETPVALLDDVLSELDHRRQTDLLRFLEGWQVFLTCCEPSHLLHGRFGKAFELNQGNIKEL
jgi:DNA replication and repair protein RecF